MWVLTRKDRHAEQGRLPSKINRLDVIALALAILAAIGILTAIVLQGADQEPGACASVSSDSARLACYDREAHRPPAPPARGELAPTLIAP